MKNLTDFHKTVETGVDPRLHFPRSNKPGYGSVLWATSFPQISYSPPENK